MPAKKEEPADDDDVARNLQVASGLSSAKRSRSPSLDRGDAGEGKRWKGQDEAVMADDLEKAAGEEAGGAQVVTGQSP
jgi:hypothetical protein